jgi:hypothetical protein
VTERRTRSASTTAPRAVWEDDVENLYESWHRRSAAAEAGHRRMAERMRRRYVMLGIPIVVLTTIVGTSVFASLQHEAVSTPLRIVVGSLSILAAVMSSLQAFLRDGTRAARRSGTRPCVAICRRRSPSHARLVPTRFASSTAFGNDWTDMRKNPPSWTNVCGRGWKRSSTCRRSRPIHVGTAR